MQASVSRSQENTENHSAKTFGQMVSPNLPRNKLSSMGRKEGRSDRKDKENIMPANANGNSKKLTSQKNLLKKQANNNGSAGAVMPNVKLLRDEELLAGCRLSYRSCTRSH